MHGFHRSQDQKDHATAAQAWATVRADARKLERSRSDEVRGVLEADLAIALQAEQAVDFSGDDLTEARRWSVEAAEGRREIRDRLRDLNVRCAGRPSAP